MVPFTDLNTLSLLLASLCRAGWVYAPESLRPPTQNVHSGEMGARGLSFPPAPNKEASFSLCTVWC